MTSSSPIAAQTPWDELEIPKELQAFVDVGLISAADLTVVAVLTIGQPCSPAVRLALALALAAPQDGHVGVSLAKVAGRAYVDRPGLDLAGLQKLPWPESVAWLEEIQQYCLVADTTSEPLRPFVLVGDLLLTRRYWRYQERLAAELRERMAGPAAWLPLDDAELPNIEADLSALFGPRPAQGADLARLAAAVVARRSLSVISGGPGTGKTFTIRKVLALVYRHVQRAQGRAPVVQLAAPTGKAAARMAEAIAEGLADPAFSPQERAWLATLKPQTVHRLLGFDPRHPSQFQHHRLNPLVADVVVVDEASMVDLALMTKLVEAVAQSSRLILLGDRQQLASVQAGSVLADLSDVLQGRGTRLPQESLDMLAPLCPAEDLEPFADPSAPLRAGCVVQFTEPRRFGRHTPLGRLAMALAVGDVPAALEQLRADGPSDVQGAVTWVPAAADAELGSAVWQIILAGYAPYLQALRQGPQLGESVQAHHLRVIGMFDEFRVLCPHRHGPLGAQELGLAIAQALRPGREAGLGRPLPATLWAGAPVLVMENRYDVGRMNGDIGIALGQDGQDRVAFADATSGQVGYLAASRLPPWELALAMTVHKSQGSQFRHTLLILPDRPSPLLTRSLIYTAVTRARERLTVVGDRHVLELAIHRVQQRASSLAEML